MVEVAQPKTAGVLRVETILPLTSIRSRNGQKGSGKVTEVVESHRDVFRGG